MTSCCGIIIRRWSRFCGVGVLLLGCLGSSCSDPGEASDTTTLQGLVSLNELEPVVDATVTLGGRSAITDLNGEFTLEEGPVGPVTVEAIAPWLQRSSRAFTTVAGQKNILDFQLLEMPLKVEPADQALMEQYHQSFDWTTAQLSISLAASPTRRELENAIFHHNPALFVDTSGEEQVTPDPLPALGIQGGTGFHFVMASGDHLGDDALLANTMVDSLDALPLSAAALGEVLMWSPLLNFLLTGDPVKAAGLNAVGKAVTSETWGGAPGSDAQHLERAYIHEDELWVEVVFKPFLTLGDGISDSDGDGFKEIFARVDPRHTTPEQLDTLRADYITPTYSTLGLRTILGAVESALYSSTNPEVVGIIGEPFEVPGLGTLNYPFVVFKANANQKTSVILVAP